MLCILISYVIGPIFNAIVIAQYLVYLSMLIILYNKTEFIFKLYSIYD